MTAAQQAAFFEFDAAGLEAWCGARGMPRFAAKQLMDWVYGKGVVDIDRMTNLSKANRDMLAHEMVFLQGSELRNLEATDGTRKLLIGWPAPGGESVTLPVLGVATGRETECVMIPSEERRTACVSSQMGCPVGCKFCASGLEGVEGNLTTGRIVEQASADSLFAFPRHPYTKALLESAPRLGVARSSQPAAQGEPCL